MGAYLDKPITDKATETGSMDLGVKENKKNLPFAVSSMQGWRKTMEDAHISMTNLEKDYDVPPGTSLFAVFDGHGGKEVSQFCAKYFVSTLMELESFKARAYREALIECFHKMDDMLRDPRYRKEIDRFAGLVTAMDNVQEDATFDDLDNIEAESEDSRSEPKKSDSEVGEENEKGLLDYIREAEKSEFDKEKDRKNSLEEEFGDGDEHSSGSKEEDKEEEEEFTKAEMQLSTRSESLNFIEVNKDATKEELKKAKEGDHKVLDDLEEPKPEVLGKEGATEKSPPPLPPNKPKKTPQEESLENDLEQAESKGSLSKNEAIDIMLKMLNLGTKKSSPNGTSNTATTPVQAAPKPNPKFGLGLIDSDRTLPTHAGTTACVTLIVEGKIYVANAGDSRAVLCREKKAVAMSYDHKPELPTEKSRIEAAGGWVTAMGRVCGNLNLSRCIGDLKYKTNENVDKSQQVITAEPDVQSVDLSEEDMFLVVACDGVWDIMTNDRIVDFVGSHLVKHSKSAKDVTNGDLARVNVTMRNTVEAVFEECICDEPMQAEGKGADNMTCVIICFRPLEELVSSYQSNESACKNV